MRQALERRDDSRPELKLDLAKIPDASSQNRSASYDVELVFNKQDVEERDEVNHPDVETSSTMSSMSKEQEDLSKRVKSNQFKSTAASQQNKDQFTEFSAKYMAVELSAALQENSDLMNQIKTLQTHVNDLQGTRYKQDEAINHKSKMISSITKMAQESVSELNKEMQRMQAQDNIKTQMVNKFAEEVKQKTSGIQSLQQQNNEFLEKIQSLTREYLKQQSEVKRITDEKKQREAQLVFCLSQLEEAQNEKKAVDMQGEEASRLHERAMDEARKEIKSLLERVNDLEEKNRDIESTKHEQSLENETRRSSMAIASTQLSASNARCTVLEMEHQELKDSLEADIAKYEQELQDSQENYKGMKARVRELESQGKNLENTNQELKDELTNERVRSQGLDSESQSLKEQLKTFQDEARLREANIKANRDELELTKKEVEKLQELKHGLEVKIANHVQEIQDYHEKYEKAKAQIQELGNTNQELKNELSNEREHSQILDSELQPLKEQRGILQVEAQLREASIKANRVELESLKQEVAELWEIITNAKSDTLTEINDPCALVDSNCQETNAKYTKASAMSKELRELLANRESELEDSKKNNGNLKDQIKEMKAKISSLERANAAIEELKVKVGFLESKNLKLNDNLTNTDNRYAALISDMEDAKQKFKHAIIEAKEYSEKLQIVNENKIKNIEELKEKVGILEHENFKLNDNLADTNNRYSALFGDMETALRRNAV